MFNRFSASSSMSTPSASGAAGNSSFFGGQPQQQGNTAAGIPAQSTSPFGNPFNSTTSNTAPASMSVPSTPYSITNELENGVTVKLLSISSMPAYRHLSQEEIRVDDYSKGRKGPSGFPGSKPGVFSQSFSSPSFPSSSYSTSTPSSGFGGFGSSSNLAAPTTSSFGGFGSQVLPSTTSTGAFGSTGSTGAFGSAGSTGAFGSTPSTSNGFTGFGSSTAPTSTTPAPASGFGGFGSSTGTGAFGSSGSIGGFGPSTPGAFGSAPSAFGSNTSGPSAFGSTTSAPFGSTTPATTPSTNMFGGFGGQSQSQPQPSGMFGAKPSTGLFGSTQTTTTQASAPSFGSSPFGGTSTSTPFGSQPTAPAFSSGFGSASQQQQQQPQQFGGIFGSSAPAATSSTTMFGQGGFGGSTQPSTSSTNIFGQQQAQAQQPTQQSTGLLGTSAAPSSLSTSTFRPTTSFNGLSTMPSTSAPLPFNSTGMFNRPATTTAGTTGTTGPFGAPSTSGFSFQQPSSSSFMSNNGLGLATHSVPSSTASVATLPLVQPAPVGSLSLFPPLPSIFTKSSEPFQAPATHATAPAAPKSPVKFTPRTSFRIKPRDSYNLTAPIPINFGSGPISSNSGGAAGSTNLVPRKMMTGSGSIPNLKKLVVPDFNDTLEPFVPSTPSTHVHLQSQAQAQTTPSSAISINASSSNILTDSMSFGQQYTFPPLKTLKTIDRRSIKNFVIGQKGIGEVRFLVPVDLSDIEPDLLFGHYIEFCEEEAVMYPDPSIPKPEAGCGLNQPAQVKLERIWTMSKGSRDPIVDPQNEKVVHFIQKLRETEGTNFISYDPNTGTWTFTVDNF